jgi:predicted DNA-binding protein YlxM (UPF0122 family)
VIGPDQTVYLVAFVVDDLSFSEMARRFGGSGAAACKERKEFSAALKTLLSRWM